VADDAGALLVRSGLVSASALEDARSRVATLGGTLGEQLVASGTLTDDVLTDFYKSRLLVPQVNPNTLARLPAKVVAVIPSDMAIELRAIPVSIDADNNLTVAMSDPSDRHAVDEIAFFTGAYVVRAVATQMQIAWCLAHYYGHVTHLGQRLLQPNAQPTAAADRAIAAAVRPTPRPRGMTGKIEAARHRALAPGAALDGARPTSEVLDEATVPTPAPEPSSDATPEPQARTVSGEIRVPYRRAPSIRPPLPDFEDESGPVLSLEAGEPSGPIITLEPDEDDEAAEPPPPPAGSDEPTDRGRRAPPRRVRPADPDPPELAARAGEIGTKAALDRELASEEPRVVIAEDLDAPRQRPRTSSEPPLEVSGEISLAGLLPREDQPSAPHITVEVSDEMSEPVVIREGYAERSEPVLLDRRRAEPFKDTEEQPAMPADDADVVVLDARKTQQVPRVGARRTQVGVGVVPAVTRPRAELVDDLDEPTPTLGDADPTRVDTLAAPPGELSSSDDLLAAPPSPAGDDDTSPHVLPPPARSETTIPPPSGKVKLDNVRPRLPSEDDDEGPPGRPTAVMSAVDLAAVMPERGAQQVDFDPIDDGWGPPGTTIPPPLLGAIPGSVEPQSGIIPIPSMDSAPLLVTPPAAPETSRPDLSAQTLGRALEEATARVLDLIRLLEHAQERDEVVAAMVEHLAKTHRRAGFFAARAGELSLFAMSPRPAEMSTAGLRLDRPSTLQDVVGTRLPYRGPMHDDASRSFLAAVLGASPPEILLVPVAVRERVVGVLFGEQRLRHTFDDQLALAGRAAGVALERILKARRG